MKVLIEEVTYYVEYHVKEWQEVESCWKSVAPSPHHHSHPNLHGERVMAKRTSKVGINLLGIGWITHQSIYYRYSTHMKHQLLFTTEIRIQNISCELYMLLYMLTGLGLIMHSCHGTGIQRQCHTYYHDHNCEVLRTIVEDCAIQPFSLPMYD